MNKKILSYVASCALVTVGLAGLAGAADTKLTKGRIPKEARVPGEPIRVELVPDYIIAYDRSGEIAGYVSKKDLFGKGSKHQDSAIVVVDETLKNTVGHMVPGFGFIALDVVAESPSDQN